MENDELLFPLEKEKTNKHWLAHIARTRNNFLATIQFEPAMWDAFQRLDNLFVRELDDLQPKPPKGQFLITNMFGDSHIRFRLAAEVGTSGMVIPAWGIMRGAIENAVQAHKLHREPELREVWIKKTVSKDDGKKYRAAFDKDKRKNLYDPRHRFLVELGDWFGKYSEWGSHSGMATIAIRGEHSEGMFRLEYFQVNEMLVPYLHNMFHVACLVEETFYDIFQNRFKLDAKLIDMREKLAKHKVALASYLMKKYSLKERVTPPHSSPA